MRELDEQALKDISQGSAVLGTGGGGDPYLGTLAALRAMKQFGEPRLITLDDVQDDDLVAAPLMFGAPVPFIEKMTFDKEMLAAFDALSKYLGRRPNVLAVAEAGGVNGIAALALSARLQLPVVDADLVGRAIPTLNMTTFSLHGLSVTPAALADENGNVVVVDTVNAAAAENLMRGAAMEFGAIAGFAGFVASGADFRRVAVHDSVSFAERIGRAIRTALEAKSDPFESLVAETGGFELFRGKIVDVDRRTEDGWTSGKAVIEGFGEQAGAHVSVAFQNENLTVQDDNGRFLATVPDLITILDAETSRAITTDRLKYGFRVVVFGIPGDKQWRTPEGLAITGPRVFNYDVDYVPIEDLVAQGRPVAAIATPGSAKPSAP